jgi:hypothetical protein
LKFENFFKSLLRFLIALRIVPLIQGLSLGRSVITLLGIKHSNTLRNNDNHLLYVSSIFSVIEEKVLSQLALAKIEFN